MERRSCLSTRTMNPPNTVLRFRKVLSGEIAYVTEGDAGERGKEKHVTHKIEVRFRQWSVHHLFQFLFGKELRDNLWIIKRITVKGSLRKDRH